MKKYITLSICSVLLSLNACITQNNLSQNSSPVTVQQSNAQENNIQVVDVGNGKITGASFMAKINFQEGFNTKANTNGALAKTLSDINKVDAYLLELSSAPAAGSDPLAAPVGSAMGLSKSGTGTGFTVLFKNVPISASGKRYYVGLVAKDTAGNVISKNPATDWTGASANKGLAISSTGGETGNLGSVTVSSSYVVSSAADLGVSISLLDAVGAQIESTATVTNGTPSLPPINVQ